MTTTMPRNSPVIERTEHPHVVKSEGVLGGQPRIDDQRLPVRMLLDYYESGYTIDEILISYPTLTRAQLFDALSYGYDHPDEMHSLRESNKLRNVLKRNDMVFIEGRLVPRVALDSIEVRPGAQIYTWETLPAEYDE